LDTCNIVESVVQLSQSNSKYLKLHDMGGIAWYNCISREVDSLDRDTFPSRGHLRDCGHQGTLGEMPFFGEIPKPLDSYRWTVKTVFSMLSGGFFYYSFLEDFLCAKQRF